MRLSKLKNSPVKSKELVGIDKSISHLKSLLKKESQKAPVIGIWGMGGIGKTTIAKELFDQICSEYDGCCFLEKVSEELTRHGMDSLKNKLFSKLLAEDVKIDTPNWLPSDIERRIGRMKVLIVLDDVKGTDQLEKLFGSCDWFQYDSRIILTARDKQVLIANEVDKDDLFEVGVLGPTEELELFNLNAFKQSDLEVDQFCDVSKRVTEYAKGIPLVLKVLANMLRGKNKEVWESQLDKLRRLPVQEVDKVMRLSYDDLDPLEKKYFLDIACFFNGLSLRVGYITLLLKDSNSDNSVAAGLESLKDKALITISEYNVISMHDILQEMGREVVRQESREHPEKRSRLWNPDEIYDVLKNDKGTDSIRSISLRTMRKLELSPRVFDKMTKLRFLYFGDIDSFNCLPQRFQSFPTNLRYLHWMYCPLKSFPENFSAENLVILNLYDSKMEKLWRGVQDLINLKEVRFTNSKFLKELPDFSKATNLKAFHIKICKELISVHPSIFSLNRLEQLGLSWCPINALPSSFGCQSNLETLNLSYTKIESIPSSIKDLTRLRKLDIQGCKKLLSLPELPSSVETLLVSSCRSLKTVLFPSTVAEQFKENKKSVEFWHCKNLDESSLINVGLNVQINLMKYANFGSDEAMYVYPGSNVPEWFEYKTTKDDKIVDLSPPHLSPLLGFVFCFVFKIIKRSPIHYFTQMEFNISTIDVEGDGEKDGVDIYMRGPSLLKSDHVSMVYDQQCSQFLTKKAKNQARFKIKVTVRAIGFSCDLNHVELKGFGMSPINQSTYHNFIQQMEYECAEGERNKGNKRKRNLRREKP
ncbi:putative disease resistance protein At4g11170 [Medicago truncatula]|nr:putative disease resistance protein At4g11170 [Medicago truncatula]